MDIRQYKEQTTSLNVTLTAGQELSLEYRPNYLTGETLVSLKKELEKKAREHAKKLEEARRKSAAAREKSEDGEAEESDLEFDADEYAKLLIESSEESRMREQFDTLLNHLCLCLYDIDLTDGERKVPFDSGKEKRAALEIFSLNDLEKITTSITEDLSSEVKKTSTGSSAG